MKDKRKYLFIITLLPLFAFSQQTNTVISKNILEACERASYDSVIYGKHIGKAAITPDQWFIFDSLKSSCTDSTFYALTDHKSPVIRGLAFEALRDKNISLFIVALRRHENDTVFVRHQYGCLASSSPLIDYIVYNVKSLYTDKKIILSEIDSKYIETLDEKSNERFRRKLKQKREKKNAR